jgi:hypothetical protein
MGGIRRKQVELTFKPYAMEKPSLISPSWDKIIPIIHLVRVVIRAVYRIDLVPMFNKYEGGGTSSDHSRMVLKVWVHACIQWV